MDFCTSMASYRYGNLQLWHLVKVRGSSPPDLTPSTSLTNFCQSFLSYAIFLDYPILNYYYYYFLQSTSSAVRPLNEFPDTPSDNFSNSISPHSFNMGGPSCNTFINSFNHPLRHRMHLSSSFGTLSILLISNKPQKVVLDSPNPRLLPLSLALIHADHLAMAGVGYLPIDK